jgi:hypothetical protein
LAIILLLLINLHRPILIIPFPATSIIPFASRSLLLPPRLLSAPLRSPASRRRRPSPTPSSARRLPVAIFAHSRSMSCSRSAAMIDCPRLLLAAARASPYPSSAAHRRVCTAGVPPVPVYCRVSHRRRSSVPVQSASSGSGSQSSVAESSEATEWAMQEVGDRFLRFAEGCRAGCSARQ